MTIKPIPSSNLLSPDFIVTAENDLEKILLRTFVHHRTQDRSLVPWIHGHSCAQDNSGVTSFTFGLLGQPDPPVEPQPQPESNPVRKSPKPYPVDDEDEETCHIYDDVLFSLKKLIESEDNEKPPEDIASYLINRLDCLYIGGKEATSIEDPEYQMRQATSKIIEVLQYFAKFYSTTQYALEETPTVVGGGGELPEPPVALVKICVHCKEPFHPRMKKQICCGTLCRTKYELFLSNQKKMERHKRQQDEKLAQIRKEIPVKREPPAISRNFSINQ